MAYTSVKISANSSEYQMQMKSAAAQMKELSSGFTLAQSQAKLFGSATDNLKAKAETLTQKISVQKSVVQLNREQQERLTERLDKQKTKQQELKTKIDAAKDAYEKSAETTGKNSEETQKLKAELEKLEQEYKQNETAIGKTETALTNQNTKVNKATADLNNMEAELQDVNKELKNHKLNEFADACNTAGQKMESFGKKMSIVSAGIAAFATGASKMAIDFEDSIAKVSTIMDTGKMSVGDMENAIVDLSNETGIAATDIADNVYNAISAGQDTADAVDFVRQSTKLATAGFAESGATLDVLTTIMNAYGLEAGEVTNVSDMLIQTQNLGKTTVAELSSAMGKVIPTANANSVALDQLCAGYAIMTANGVATAETTTYMNSMLNELGKTGSSTDVILREKTGKSFSELMASGSSLADVLQIVDGEAKAQNLSMSDMFSSSEAAKAGLILLGDSADTFNGTLGQMRESTGATDTAFGKMETTSHDIKVTMNELKNTVMQFGQTLMTSAAPIIENVTGKIHELCEWFGNLDDGQQQTIIKAGLVAFAIGPLAIGFGKVAQGISSTIKTGQQFVSGAAAIIAKITGKTAATAAGAAADAAGTAATAAYTTATAAATATTGGMTVAQAALNAVMKLCPIILIVTLIAGLITAGVALYKNWDTVKEKLSELWGKVTEVWENIKTTISEKVEAIKTAISEKFEAIKTAISEKVEAIKTIISEKIEAAKQTVVNIFNSLKETLSNIWETIKNVVQVAVMFIGEVLSAAFDLITLPWRFVWENCKEYVFAAWDAIKLTVSSALEAIKTAISTVWNAIVSFLSPILEGIKNTFSTVWNATKTIISTVLNAISNTVSSVWNSIKTTISTVMNAISNTVSSIWNSIKTTVSSIMNAIKTTISNIWNSIKSVVSSVVNAIKSVVSSAFNSVKSTVSSIMNGIKSTMSSIWNSIKSVVSGAINGVKSTISSGLNAAKSVVSGVLEGIKSKFSSIFDSAKNIVKGAIDKIKGFFNFSWSLPRIKMPHFSISGSFSLNPPSIPHFSVDWYKHGGIMTDPTVFGMAGNTLLAGGEAGAEAILPLAEFYTRLGAMLDRKIEAIENKQNITVENHTYLDGDEITSRTVTRVNSEMVTDKRKGR